MSVIEQWNSLPRELAYEVCVFGDTENMTGQGPEQPPLFDPALSREVGLEL